MPILIEPFRSSEVDTLAELSQNTFIESHGHSAKDKDIQDYIQTHFNTKTLTRGLANPEIYYSKIYYEDQLAGYSKLILNFPHSLINSSSTAKFERLYLLKEFYGKGLGEALLNYNIKLAKKQQQKAFWLFVWTGNKKGLRFYKKSNFKIIGEHDFKISEDHSNPNYVMKLAL